MKTITLMALCCAVLACSAPQRLTPHYAVSTHGGVELGAVAGNDTIAAHADRPGLLRIHVKARKGERYTRQWDVKLKAGQGFYRHVTWGPEFGGWIRLEPVTCEWIRTSYQWLVCPAIDERSMTELVKGVVERRQMFVGVE